MDEVKITPTPWRLFHPTSVRVVAGKSPELYTLFNCWNSPFSPHKMEAIANARYIVAAVNACSEAGISVEELEAAGLDGVRLRAGSDPAYRRDEP